MIAAFSNTMLGSHQIMFARAVAHWGKHAMFFHEALVGKRWPRMLHSHLLHGKETTLTAVPAQPPKQNQDPAQKAAGHSTPGVGTRIWPIFKGETTSAWRQSRSTLRCILGQKQLVLLGWGPSLLGWRASRVGWRPSLLGCRPSLLGWRSSLIGWTPIKEWRPSLVGSRASLLGRRLSLGGLEAIF